MLVSPRSISLFPWRTGTFLISHCLTKDDVIPFSQVSILQRANLSSHWAEWLLKGKSKGESNTLPLHKIKKQNVKDEKVHHKTTERYFFSYYVCPPQTCPLWSAPFEVSNSTPEPEMTQSSLESTVKLGKNVPGKLLGQHHVPRRPDHQDKEVNWAGFLNMQPVKMLCLLCVSRKDPPSCCLSAASWMLLSTLAIKALANCFLWGGFFLEDITFCCLQVSKSFLWRWRKTERIKKHKKSSQKLPNLKNKKKKIEVKRASQTLGHQMKQLMYNSSSSREDRRLQIFEEIMVVNILNWIKDIKPKIHNHSKTKMGKYLYTYYTHTTLKLLKPKIFKTWHVKQENVENMTREQNDGWLLIRNNGCQR